MNTGAPDQALARLLTEAAEGRVAARDELMKTLYANLRAVARRKLAAERAGHTLSATALVHEAFLRLVGQERTPTDRAHFLAIASLAMRRVLVSHARQRRAQKRGGAERAITLDEEVMGIMQPGDDIAALDEALERLAQLSERQSQVVAYRAFGALTDAEIAAVLDVSVPTVRRDARVAMAWLRRELSR